MSTPFWRFLILLGWISGGIPLAWSQVNEDFSDPDLSRSPAWQGDLNRWRVNNDAELQSDNGNANGTEVIYLSTPSTRLSDTEWRVYMRYLTSGPSANNQMRFYLLSDQADLRGPLNGYYVEVGENGSDDSYDLYRQDGDNHTRLIDGLDGRAGTGIDAVVQVKRDTAGNWQMAVDLGAGTFEPQGSAMDQTYLTGTHMGLWVSHTSTRGEDFFWDDVYVGEEIIDTEPPNLLSLSPLTPTELELKFSESLDLTSAENEANYTLAPGVGSPRAAQRSPGDLSQVRLTLDQPLVNNQGYQLRVQGVADLSGNAIATAQQLDFTFLIPETAAYRDIILNELMPDPNPSQGLPEEEYVELYNRSDKVIDLSGWTISDGNRTGTLPSHILQPGEYVMLVNVDDAPLFASLGPLISPGTLPSLNNGGDLVVLTDAAGNRMDSLRYTADWYQDPDRSNGGYSLELVNPDNLDCPPAGNWRASEDPQGGTPGQPNSVLTFQPETDPPAIATATVPEPREVQLCFDEVMDPASLVDPAAYDLAPGLGPPTAVAVGPDARCVMLTFGSSFNRGQVYTLTISGVQDCSGNALAADEEISVARGVLTQASDVIITEIMPNPEPVVGLPAFEYVELYNRRTEAVELTGFQFSDSRDTVFWGDQVLLPSEYLILCDEEAAPAFEGRGRVLPLPFLPNLNNAGDSLQLLSPFGGVIDYVAYSDKWYRDEARRDGGYSLERVDRDLVACDRADNWQASLAPDGGTPGQPNSVDGTLVDSLPPAVSRIAVLPDGLKLTFSEPMDLVTLEDSRRYQVDQGVGEPVLALASQPNQRSVRLLLGVPLDTNRVYRLGLDSLADCLGNVLSAELSFGVPVPPQEGDLLINEVLFNPYTGGADFVEVANASANLLDLRGLRLGEGLPDSDTLFNDDPISEASYLLLPGQLVCLTRDIAIQRQRYRPPLDARFLAMDGFPSYADREGTVVLFTPDSLVLDRLTYLDDWHYPTLSDNDGVALERLSLRLPTQQASNWHSASSLVGYATPGYANSQAQALADTDSEVYLGRETFSPDLDGVDDLLPIHYQFDFVGANARVYIYDTRGHLVRRLQENVLLDPSPGVFFWDGFGDNGQKAPIGMYVVRFEVVNDDTGKRHLYRRVAVLAERLE